MLRANPNERVTAKDALKHMYFADILEEMKPIYVGY